jgi:hypothetical protein
MNQQEFMMSLNQQISFAVEAFHGRQTQISKETILKECGELRNGSLYAKEFRNCLIVFPSHFINFHTQMFFGVKMENAAVGVSCMDGLLRYMYEGPCQILGGLTKPYLIFDIQDGRDTAGLPQLEALEIFKKEKRSVLSAEEGIGLIRQNLELLHKIQLYLPGCCCDSSKGPLPATISWFFGSPTLYYGEGFLENVGHPRWGTPSCGARYIPELSSKLITMEKELVVA